MWSSAYFLEISIHQILAELYPIENVCNFFLFLANSSYSLHLTKLKLSKKLHDDVEQRILPLLNLYK